LIGGVVVLNTSIRLAGRTACTMRHSALRLVFGRHLNNRTALKAQRTDLEALERFFGRE